MFISMLFVYLRICTKIYSACNHSVYSSGSLESKLEFGYSYSTDLRVLNRLSFARVDISAYLSFLS